MLAARVRVLGSGKSDKSDPNDARSESAGGLGYLLGQQLLAAWETTFTLVDTLGCSAEQIIAALGLGSGHTRFGLSLSAMRQWVALVNT